MPVMMNAVKTNMYHGTESPTPGGALALAIACICGNAELLARAALDGSQRSLGDTAH